MNKAQVLSKIAEEIKHCSVCKVGKVGEAVAGEGDPDADIMFLGEAPGKKEAKVGRPFVGRSGKLLRSLIRDAGLKEEEVFITSPVKYLPLRGIPTREDIKHGLTHLQKQIAVIDPKLIVVLGKTAAYAMLGESVAINKEHGKVIVRDGKRYFLTFHPAAAVRFQKNRTLLLKDFKKLSKILFRN